MRLVLVDDSDDMHRYSAAQIQHSADEGRAGLRLVSVTQYYEQTQFRKSSALIPSDNGEY